jgi:site-specific DNA recombinase
VEKVGVGYIRVSGVGGRGDDLISPEIQRHAIERFAAREGIRIVAEIRDIDRSGRSFTKRRADEAIEGIRNGRWGYVVLWNWSRWGRNLKESLLHLQQVEEAGGFVRSATEDLDPDTTVGRFTRDQMLLVAQLQSDMVSDGWKEVQAKRRRDGLPHTGAKRWGYDYDKRTGFTPHPGQAQVLAGAYEQYVAGTSHRNLALSWNAMGLRTTRGQRWSLQSISRMMDTGFAAGLIRERTKPPSATDSGGKNGRAIWTFDVWREGAHKPVISKALWEAYKMRRDAQATMAPRLRTAAHALSGLMVCGDVGCGGPMVSTYSGRHNKHSWVCYQARDRKVHPFNSVSNGRAMTLVLAWVADQADGGVSERIEAGRHARCQVEGFDAEIKRLTMKRSRLANAYTDGDIEREDYRAQKAEIDEALGAATEGRQSAIKREAASGVSVVGQFRALRDNWDRLEPSEHRELMASVVARIIVQPGPFGPGKVVPVPVWEG